MCRGNPHQFIPSTTVTASHVTHGRAEYESTIPRGTDEGLDLWETMYEQGKEGREGGRNESMKKLMND